MPCSVELSQGRKPLARSSGSIDILPNARISLTIVRYTATFAIVGTPQSGRGSMRVQWRRTGESAPAVTANGDFDARNVGAFGGTWNVPDGTLQYDCGQLGRD